MKIVPLRKRSSSLVSIIREEFVVAIPEITGDSLEVIRSLLMMDFKKVKILYIKKGKGLEVAKRMKLELRPFHDVMFQKVEDLNTCKFDALVNFGIDNPIENLEVDHLTLDYSGISVSKSSDNTWVKSKNEDHLDLDYLMASKWSILSTIISSNSDIAKILPEEKRHLEKSLQSWFELNTARTFFSLVNRVNSVLFVFEINKALSSKKDTSLIEQIFQAEETSEGPAYLTSAEFVKANLNLKSDFYMGEVDPSEVLDLFEVRKVAIRGFGGIGFHSAFHMLPTNFINAERVGYGSEYSCDGRDFFKPNNFRVLIMDDDTVELHNLSRLPCSPMLAQYFTNKVDLAYGAILNLQQNIYVNSKVYDQQNEESSVLESLFFLRSNSSINSFPSSEHRYFIKHHQQHTKEAALLVRGCLDSAIGELNGSDDQLDPCSFLMNQRETVSKARECFFKENESASSAVNTISISETFVNDSIGNGQKQSSQNRRPERYKSAVMIGNTSNFLFNSWEAISNSKEKNIVSALFRNLVLTTVSSRTDPKILNWIQTTGFRLRNDYGLRKDDLFDSISKERDPSAECTEAELNAFPLELLKLIEASPYHGLQGSGLIDNVGEVSFQNFKANQMFIVRLITVYTDFVDSFRIDTIDSFHSETAIPVETKFNYDGLTLGVTLNPTDYFNSLVLESPVNGYLVIPSFYGTPRILGLLAEGQIDFGKTKGLSSEQVLTEMNSILKPL